jgi:hypothetical protein
MEEEDLAKAKRKSKISEKGKAKYLKPEQPDVN